MADTVKVKVNADGVSWEEPNPVPNQPPRSIAAYKGAVVEMPASEAQRLRDVRVRVYYTDPISGVPGGAYREEPAVVDANEAEAADAEAVAAAQRRVRELEDALAQAKADLPLSPTAPAAVAPPAPLLPSQGAPRLLADDQAGLPTVATGDEESGDQPPATSAPSAPPAPTAAPATKAAAPTRKR